MQDLCLCLCFNHTWDVAWNFWKKVGWFDWFEIWIHSDWFLSNSTVQNNVRFSTRILDKLYRSACFDTAMHIVQRNYREYLLRRDVITTSTKTDQHSVSEPLTHSSRHHGSLVRVVGVSTWWVSRWICRREVEGGSSRQSHCVHPCCAVLPCCLPHRWSTDRSVFEVENFGNLDCSLCSCHSRYCARVLSWGNLQWRQGRFHRCNSLCDNRSDGIFSGGSLSFFFERWNRRRRTDTTERWRRFGSETLSLWNCHYCVVYSDFLTVRTV